MKRASGRVSKRGMSRLLHKSNNWIEVEQGKEVGDDDGEHEFVVEKRDCETFGKEAEREWLGIFL